MTGLNVLREMGLVAPPEINLSVGILLSELSIAILSDGCLMFMD